MTTNYILYASYNYGSYEPVAGQSRIDDADKIAKEKLSNQPEIDYIDLVDAGGKHMFKYSRQHNGEIKRQMYVPKVERAQI